MIKALLAALIGVDPDVWDSDENQELWEQQRSEDESDGEDEQEVEKDE